MTVPLQPGSAPAPRWWAAPLEVRWRIPGALLPWGVFVVILLVQLGAGLLLQAGGLQPARGPIGFAVGLGAYVLLALTVVLVVRLRGSGSLRRDLGLAFRPVDLAIGLAAFVGVEIVRIVLGVIVVLLVGPPSHGNIVIDRDPLWFVLTNVLIACVVAPLVEEAMSRGLVLRAFRDAMLRRAVRLGRPLDDAGVQIRAGLVGVLVSSAIFAAAHLYQGYDDPRVMLVLATSILPMALVSGCLALFTRRLGASIVLHVLVNLTAILLAVATLPR